MTPSSEGRKSRSARASVANRADGHAPNAGTHEDGSTASSRRWSPRDILLKHVSFVLEEELLVRVRTAPGCLCKHKTENPK